MQSSSSPEYKVSVFGSTNVGSVRSHNEDNFLVCNLTTETCSLQPEVRNHIVGERGSLFMVADGMGGGAAGEVASQLAITNVYERLSERLKTQADLGKSSFAHWLKDAVEYANGVIYRESRNNPEYKGMGTTTSAAGFLGGTLYVAQVGDSRAYLVRRGAIKQITKDQSLVNKLLDAGLITEEEAENHENKNVILQALGVGETVDVVLSCIDVRQDDFLVLCSDGLSGLVKADEIRHHVETAEDLVTACRLLIDLANERGGYDNITVIVAKFSGSGLQPATGQDVIEYTLFDDQEATTAKIQGSPTVQVEKKKPLEPTTPRIPKSALSGVVALVIVAVALILWGLRQPATEAPPRTAQAVPAAERSVPRSTTAQPTTVTSTLPVPPGGETPAATSASSPVNPERSVAATPAPVVPASANDATLPRAESRKMAPSAGVPKAGSPVPVEKVRTFEETASSQGGRNIQAERPAGIPEPAAAAPVQAAPAKAERQPETPEPAQQPATAEKVTTPVVVTIQSNPAGLSFFIDGEAITLSTPAELKLTPGKHVLKFKFGPLVIERPIEVRSASDKPFVFDLETVIQKSTIPPDKIPEIG